MDFAQYAQSILNSYEPVQQGDGVSMFDASKHEARAIFNTAPCPANGISFASNIQLGFLGTNAQNAYADRHADCYFLSMHSSLFQSFVEFSNFCFSQNDFMRFIGDPEKETSPVADEAFARGLGFFNVERTRTGGRLTIRGRQHPRCLTRMIHASHLAQLMARFVWLHEYAHCVRGHLDLLRNMSKVTRFCEAPSHLGIVGFSEQNAAPLKANLLKSLEVDADRWALAICLDVQLQDREPEASLAKKPLEIRLHLMVFALLSIIWLFEEYCAGRKTPDHPETDLRLVLNVGRIRECMNKLAPKHASLVDHVCEQFDAIRRAIPHFFTNTDIQNRLSDPELTDQVEQMNEAIGQLNSRLRPLADFQPRLGQPVR